MSAPESHSGRESPGWQEALTGHLAALARLMVVAAAIIMATTSGDSGLTQVERIKARGSLVMLTVNGASTYYLGSEGETGFEYELALAFSRYLDVPLQVVTLPSVGDLVPALLDGRGDFVAANLTRTPLRQSRLRFGPAYEEVVPTVVYRRGSPRPRSVEELAEGRLALIDGTVYQPLLSRHEVDIEPEIRRHASIEDLFESISSEEIDYTIIDSNILELNRRFFPAIRPAFELGELQPLAWATERTNDDSLVQAMREFFLVARADSMLADLRQRHYGHVENYEPVGTFTFMRQIRERLPRLRPFFEEAAAEHDLDWRLLAAVGYQESHWDPSAVSRTGVRGIMMLTRRTARQLGIDNRVDPEQSIMGGARYLRSMIDRVPDRIDYPDRLWLALAAYNIGYGHLEDARVLTEIRGGDPDRWVDVRESLPLLTQERWYSQTRYGYARGYEPVQYVENVRTFFEILLWMEGRDHPLLAEASDAQDASAEQDAPTETGSGQSSASDSRQRQ
ncbi:MAG: membrane-bound lytic murein transglycosylase MltF [Gammaproteobacteria bacterium]|jgi:membrane-bound lytic murein transglycosylase F|nr:membrane-bound lytic murein transglycosylase MltF [Gammaproteobacteria bacterium]